MNLEDLQEYEQDFYKDNRDRDYDRYQDIDYREESYHEFMSGELESPIYNARDFEEENFYNVEMLMKHPHGGSRSLDLCNQVLTSGLKKQHRKTLEKAYKHADHLFNIAIYFQKKYRQENCPVCIEPIFDTCKQFYRCEQCDHGICTNCRDSIYMRTTKCPICRQMNSFKIIKRDKHLDLTGIPPELSIYEFLNKTMYQTVPGEDYNIFGEQLKELKNYKVTEKTPPEEFDLTLAEFLRMSENLLKSIKDWDPVAYTELIDTQYWWLKELEPYLTGTENL